MRRISIFGVTGSIGQNTLSLIQAAPAGSYQVVAVTGGRNIEQLARDAIASGAKVAVTAFDDEYQHLKDILSGSSVTAAAGRNALIEAAQQPVDWAMSAIVGADGLEPGLNVVRQGATLALANKESLVTAGSLLMGLASQHHASIIPVDSEHSGIFQALQGENIETVERIVLTASGGAFRDWPLEKLANAKPEEAAQHPNWSMGQRITIDSASMFNKAMEVIETHAFFGVEPEKIEVLIHPESLIHAMVGFCDGGLIAHVGPPDMRHAIGYALNWPKRQHLPVDRLDLAAIGRFSFSAPDPARYPAIGLAYQVMQAGGIAGAVFTAAKDAALDAFISGQIGFTDMAGVVEAVLESHMKEKAIKNSDIDLEKIKMADKLAREAARQEINRRRKGR